MVIRCHQCKGLLQVDEKNLPSDRRAKIRCPHCKGIGLMPDMSHHDVSGQAQAPGSGDPQGGHYPVLVPAEQPRQPRDWKETALPQDAFKTFRYPAEREETRESARKPSRRGLPLWVWVVVSVAVVAFFALLVNVILPGPAGVRPIVHTVPPEHAGPPKVSEENVPVPNRERTLPGLQDR